MRQATDVKIIDVALYFLPVRCEVPLGFGGETVATVTCARAAVTVADSAGNSATGWGETPLNVQWAWPGTDGTALPLNERERIIKETVIANADRLRHFPVSAHPMEISTRYMDEVMPSDAGAASRLPALAAMLCYAPFDLALYDAYGRIHRIDVFETLTEGWMNYDLGRYFGDDGDVSDATHRRYPLSFLRKPLVRMPVWHMVGSHDLLREDVDGFAESFGGVELPEPVHLGIDRTDRGHLPRTLNEWIRRDGIRFLKVKLRGRDPAADIDRIAGVAAAAGDGNDIRLSLDLNRTAPEAGYVHILFDAMERDMPEMWKRLLYVEEPLQPAHVDDTSEVTSLSRRKPLFMDESASHWIDVVRGRRAGWSGVALKTCKTLTGSLLSLCLAREGRMPVMVQDLTNPMLAQLTHLSFASRVPTEWGVESNSMQFYPEASRPEEAVHPGAYRRSGGMVDISTLRGAGFGYRLEEMKRELPPRVA